MYRTIILLTMLLFCLHVPSLQAKTLIAPTYPEAVPFCSDRPGLFLSKDTFEEVKSFYSAKKGTATWEKKREETGQSAFFEYMGVREVHKYDPVGSAIGVTIYTQGPFDNGDPETSLPVVGEIFGKLKMLTMQGSLSPGQYEQIVKKYSPLASWYFAISENESRLMNEVIVDRCKMSQVETDSVRDMETMARKAQQLMMQGRQREALEIMQRISQSSQEAHQQSISSDGVEKWVNCLQELQKNGYPTKIEISLNPTRH